MEGLILKRSIIISLVVVLLAMVVLTGCDNYIEVMYSGSNVGNKIDGSYKLFTGTKTKTINAEKGKTIVINYSSEVKKGELTLKIYDSDENVALELETNKTGIKELIPEKDGKYKLIITGSKTEGNFNVKWDIK
jgi:hypothetical protein